MHSVKYQRHYGKLFYQDKKTGYWISTKCPKKRAHVWVWEYHNGKRPKGFHIHHRDQNKSNNSIENLELLSPSEHSKIHMTEQKKELATKTLNKIRPLTKKWHRSEEGRKWHKENGIQGWIKKKEIEIICDVCGKLCKTKTYHQRFCSNKCKSRFRRDEKIDDIEIECVICKIIIRRNKYAKSKTCSAKCGGIFKSKKYKESKK